MKKILLQTIELAFVWTLGVLGAVIIGYLIINAGWAIDYLVTSLLDSF